jgi:integrating conjugative element protein (TIGR03755 family)
MRSIGVGLGWNSNLICGDMSIQTTLRNQLNGITNGFQQIMSNVIQSATSAVASLPALIIQRADPGLYNLLTNGVLQARLDFDRSKLTCRAMAEKMAETAGGQLGWSQMAEGMALRDAVSSTDAVSAIEQAETRRGNDGVPWVGGSNAGGAGQSAIRVVGDVTRAGYNLVNGRSVTDTSSIAPASCASLSCQTWTSPQQATEWATRVLGEQVAAHVRFLHQDRDHAWRRADAADPGGVRDQAGGLAGTGLGTRNTTFENLRMQPAAPRCPSHAA